MRILIDGDACPNKEQILQLAKKYEVEMIVFTDYAHAVRCEEYATVMCEVGADSVDMKIINTMQSGDIVVTQDYGLSSLVLGKGGYVVHVSGKIIDQNNIDQLLMTRFIAAKQRKAGGRTKGPSKRTKADEQYFIEQLERVIKNLVV